MQNYDLPHGAFDVEDLGNGWFYFMLRVGGEARMFLYRRYVAMGNHHATEVITELR